MSSTRTQSQICTATPISKCRHMNKFTLKCFKNRWNIILMILFANIFSFRFKHKTNVVDHHLMIG